MSSQKKILFLLPALPYPLNAGGNQAVFNGISAIKNNYEVHVIYIDPIHRSSKKNVKQIECLLEKKVSLVPFKYNPFKTFYRCFNFFRNLAAYVLKISKKDNSYSFDLIPEKFKPLSQRYINFVNAYIINNKIDIVQMEMLRCLSAVLTLPPSVKKIFIHHELGYIVNEQKCQLSDCCEYCKANVEIAKILELSFLNKCDAIVTLSEIDKEKLIKEKINVQVFTSFAVVNTKIKMNNDNNHGNILTFVGPAAHTPNYIGIQWFLENCWNTLLQKDSSYTLKIVGNWSDDKREELSKKYKNIEFLGFVPNLADALNNTIMIVPITVGSGIRMKILEAACLGIPFVSTTVGAEGLPFESGRDCFKADTPESFVKAIVDLKDKSLREKFAQNANAIVKEKYSMEALRKNRLEIYEKVLNENKNENL